MTFSLKHTFTSPKADGADPTVVQPSNWNAEHTITLATGNVLGRSTAGAGAVEELPFATVVSQGMQGVTNDGGSTVLTADGYVGASTNGVDLVLRRARGSLASPSAVLNNDYLGSLNFRGYGATGFSGAARAIVGAKATENWTDAAQGSAVVFENTAAGTVTRTEKARISSAGNMLVGTSSDLLGRLAVQGGKLGTANASAAFGTAGAAQGEVAAIALYGTFTGSADNGIRRIADITAGFNGGTWGKEYISFNVGNGGASNDSKLATVEQLRIDGTGLATFTGKVLATASMDVRGALNIGDGTIRLAAYADNADGGITLEAANYANTTKKNLYLVPYGGAVGIGTTGVAGWFGFNPMLLVSQNSNAANILGMNNQTVGASSSMEFRMIGGTANSYSTFGLYDNNGAPFYRDSLGAGVFARDWWMGGSQAMKLDANGNLNTLGVIASGRFPTAGTTATMQAAGDMSLFSGTAAVGINAYYSGGFKAGAAGYGQWLKNNNDGKLQLYMSNGSAAADGVLAMNNVMEWDGLNQTVNLPLTTSEYRKNGVTIAPWINVKTDYGAAGDGATSDTTAINNAIAAANASGRSILFPPGTYKITAALNAITRSGVRVIGAGRNATIIAMASATGNTMTLQGQFSSIEDMSFAPSVFRTSGYEIVVDSGFLNVLRNVFISFGYRGVSIVSTAQCLIENVHLRYMTGDVGVYYGGTASVGSYGMWAKNLIADNPYVSNVFNANIKAWATSTAYVVGDCFKISGWIWQVTTAGTSTTTAPAAPTTTAWYTTSVANGTMQVRAIARDVLTWFYMDSYSNSLTGVNCAFIDGNIGFGMYDSANTTGSYPSWAYFYDLEVDHAWSAGVDCGGGLGFHATGSWIGSTYQGNGVQFGSLYKGETIIDNTRIVANGQHGVLFNTGTDHKLTNCIVSVNGINGPAGTYHGVVVGAGVTKFTVQNNTLGGSVAGLAGTTQGWGVIVSTGASDYYIVSGNMGNGNTLGTVSDGGTGTHKSVTGNV